MTGRRISSPAARRLVSVAALSLLLTPLTAPSSAASAATTAPLADVLGTTATPAPPTDTARGLADEVAETKAAYTTARQAVVSVRAQHKRLDDNASAASDRAAELQRETADDGGLLSAVGDLLSPGPSDLDKAQEAAEDAEHALELAALAEKALTKAISTSEAARIAWESATRALAQEESRWSAREAADASIRRSQFSERYAVTDRPQDQRNQKALRSWHTYLDDLADVSVVPPPAKRLADPETLPGRFDLVRDAHGKAVAGVAEIDPLGERGVPVIPAETVRAVSDAFRRVGLDEVPGDVDPTAYACGGFVTNVWASTETTVPADVNDQWGKLRRVPREALQLGDIVVLGNEETGIAQSGIHVGADSVIVADPDTGVAAVEKLRSDNLLGVRRVALPREGQNEPAPTTGICAPEDAAPVVTPPSSPGLTLPGFPVTTDGFGLPLAAGSYRISAYFGQSGSLWSSGQHTGQDFSADTGTPVVAVADGVVAVEYPSWAGNWVRIDHGAGIESSYAHLSAVDVTTGQFVQKGQLIGAVGSEGNSTGPHLHFEIRLDDVTVDPALIIDIPERPRPTYSNGQMPDSALCDATPGGHRLSCDAAVSYRLLAADYQAAMGSELCITDSYRTLEGQQALALTKPGLAATPGTSVHGWGRAVDLCGGVETFGTAQHEWMVANGPSRGWVHPDWAGASGSRPEPWHFEYGV
ncbi:peptidoglycan DD-metalloendopeptidase family protein [Nocardioides pacificus]